MPDITRHFTTPSITSNNLIGSRSTRGVQHYVLNPGAFKFKGKTCLLLQVTEELRESSLQGIHTLVNGINRENKIDIQVYSLTESDGLSKTSPRVLYHENTKAMQLIAQSHPSSAYNNENTEPQASDLDYLPIRMAYSDNGTEFQISEHSHICGIREMEEFGIEDCRVTEIDETYYLTYTAISRYGAGVIMVSTHDWREFTSPIMILPPDDRDCALFPRKTNGLYYALHHPTMENDMNIWIGESDNLTQWGNHKCLLATRPQMWDSKRISASGSPYPTSKGWLVIYQGVDNDSRYRLGAALLDSDNPTKVLARSQNPLMEPEMKHELAGFYKNIVFINDSLIGNESLEVTVFYGTPNQDTHRVHIPLEDIFTSLV